MEERLTPRPEPRDLQGLPPDAPLEMPKQVLERRRDDAVAAFLLRLFARHA